MKRRTTRDCLQVRIVVTIVLWTISGVMPGLAFGQTHPILDAPAVSTPTDVPVRDVYLEIKTTGPILEVRQVEELPSDQNRLTISNNGADVSNILLVSDSTSRAPSSIMVTDSSHIILLENEPDSGRGFTHISFEWNSSGTISERFAAVPGELIIASSYPDMHEHLLPEVNAPRLARTSVSYRVTDESVVVTPAARERLPDTVAAMRYTSSKPVSRVGFYLAAGRLESISDRVIVGSGSVDVNYFSSDLDQRELLRKFGSAPESIRFLDRLIGVAVPDRTVNFVSTGAIHSDGVENLIGLFGDSDESAGAGESNADVLSTASAVAFNYFGRHEVVSDSDSWLYTGLPSYLGAMFLNADAGEAAFDSLMVTWEDRYLEESRSYRRPLFHPRWYHPTDLHDQHAFSKGAWTVHMIRNLAGDEAFGRTLKELFDSGLLSSDNLTQILEQELDDNLESFQRYMVYEPGHLALRVDWSYSSSDGRVTININNESEAPPFPVDIEIETLTGSNRIKATVEGPSTSVSANVSGRPRYITIDPDQKLLAQVTVDQPVASWVNQLRNAQNLGVRIKAARALRTFANDPALLIGLKSAFRDESSVLVRAAIIETVGAIPPGSASLQTLIDALEDVAPLVRVASLRALSSYSSDLQALNAVNDLIGRETDEKVLASAVAFIAFSNSRDRDAILESALITETPQSLVREAGLKGLAVVSETALNLRQISRRFLRPEYSNNVRLAALSLALQIETDRTDRRIALVESLLSDSDPSLRAGATAYLPVSPESTQVLRAKLQSETNASVRRSIRNELFRRLTGAGTESDQ